MFRAFFLIMMELAALSASVAWAGEAASGTTDEIVALQRRLKDAGCYAGALDGNVGSAFDAALKACPDMKPSLRIETGMHVASLRRSGVDAGCTRLATSSSDKTIRIWSLPDGKLEQTVRLPIGEGNAGKIYATALSPDGKTLAAGGWDAYFDKNRSFGLYIVDIASGAVRHLAGLPNLVNIIAFSPDGARVAVGLGRGWA